MRTVTGTIYHLDGTPWIGGEIKFQLMEAFETSTKVFPKYIHSETLDSSGEFSVELSVPDSGTAEYLITMPDNGQTIVYLAAGPATNLQTLRALAGSAVAQNPNQTAIDAAIAGLAGVYLNLGGGTLTGQLAINRTTGLCVNGTEYKGTDIYLGTNAAINGSPHYIGAAVEGTFSGPAIITGSVVGLRSIGQLTTGWANIIAGIDARAFFSSPSLVGAQSLYGVRSYIQNSGVGLVNHAMAFKANAPVNSGGGTIEHNWGVYIADQNIGAIHGGAALHIEGIGVANAIAFAGDGSDGDNALIYSSALNRINIQAASGVIVAAPIDIWDGELALTLGADSSAFTRTNNTVKYGRIVAPHYLNAEESASIFQMQAGQYANILFIGGGMSAANAATYVIFCTAADNVTLTGTERMRITESGNIVIANLAGTGDRPVMAHADGTLYCA